MILNYTTIPMEDLLDNHISTDDLLDIIQSQRIFIAEQSALIRKLQSRMYENKPKIA
ncbi:MAG: hypothetical protein AB7E42_02245 [Anaerotignaceae bacterium]